MVRITGRRYDTREVVTIHCVDGCVSEIDRHADNPVPAARELPWIGPGLVDLQVNGFGGQEFTDPGLTVEHVLQISL